MIKSEKSHGNKSTKIVVDSNIDSSSKETDLPPRLQKTTSMRGAVSDSTLVLRQQQTQQQIAYTNSSKNSSNANIGSNRRLSVDVHNLLSNTSNSSISSNNNSSKSSPVHSPIKTGPCY